MRKLIIIFLTVFAFLNIPLTCLAEQWDEYDKALFTGLVALNIIDCLQTMYILDHPEEYIETNTNIKRGEEYIGDLFTPLYFAFVTSFKWWVSDKLKSTHRKIALSIWDLQQFGFVANNIKIGIGITFNF